MAIIAKDVLVALRALHDPAVNLPHNDIKTDNILVTELSQDDGSNVIEQVKLIDFGLGGTNHFYCGLNYGTREHVSPEMLKQHVTGKCPDNPIEVAKANDIWALGVVLYRFCYHRDPFKISGPRRRNYPRWYYSQYALRYDEVTKTIRKGSVLFDTGKDFLLKLLAWRPEDRPTAAEALEHPFLKQLPLKERTGGWLDHEIIEDYFTNDNS
jgi:serine/threonine protein kinase